MNLYKFLACLGLLAIAFFAHHAHAGEQLDKIVAIVNDEVISQSELDKFTKIVTADVMQEPGTVMPPRNELQQQILKRMVIDKIQMQLAKQYGIEVDSYTVSQTIQEMARQQSITMEKLKKEVEAKGISFNDYRDLIRAEMTNQTLQSREVGQDITVAKHEVESFLSSAAGQDKSGTEYQLGHILLAIPETPTPDVLEKSVSEAETMVQELRSGKDFSKTAMAKSAARHALNGGDLGWRTSAELPTLFVNYVPSMEIGDIIGPIRSSGGIHIIKLLDKRSGDKTAQIETKVLQLVIAPSNTLSKEEAKDLISGYHKQIIQGSDFNKIAEKNSSDLRTANKGGELGWVTEDLVSPEYASAMRKLRNGEVSSPFYTDEGWTVIKVLDRRTQRTSDEAAWNRAMEILTMRKGQEAVESWLKRIRDEAQVEVLLSEASQ